MAAITLRSEKGAPLTNNEVDANFTNLNNELMTAVQPGDIDLMVESDITGITGADAITNIVSLTQAEYDAIVSPDSDTLYVVI